MERKGLWPISTACTHGWVWSASYCSLPRRSFFNWHLDFEKATMTIITRGGHRRRLYRKLLEGLSFPKAQHPKELRRIRILHGNPLNYLWTFTRNVSSLICIFFHKSICQVLEISMG
ncbi:uncharacterized protein LOC143886995 [Tasmannia lanceolata]|uniref:uncharacterized protein LOC143886995 n=1 Tax=Tasmannia lanceolata TaxID=3420 RepID=UPI0040648038